jgi:hypothetical protein
MPGFSSSAYNAAFAAERSMLSGGGRSTPDLRLGHRDASHRCPPVRCSVLLGRNWGLASKEKRFHQYQRLCETPPQLDAQRPDPSAGKFAHQPWWGTSDPRGRLRRHAGYHTQQSGQGHLLTDVLLIPPWRPNARRSPAAAQPQPFRWNDWLGQDR